MIYEIFHQSFQTDDIRSGVSHVEAPSKKEALKIYNKLARRRAEYPYCWNQVTDLRHVWPLTVITKDTK